MNTASATEWSTSTTAPRRETRGVTAPGRADTRGLSVEGTHFADGSFRLHDVACFARFCDLATWSVDDLDEHCQDLSDNPAPNLWRRRRLGTARRRLRQGSTWPRVRAGLRADQLAAVQGHGQHDGQSLEPGSFRRHSRRRSVGRLVCGDETTKEVGLASEDLRLLVRELVFGEQPSRLQ